MTEIWPPAVVNEDSARGTGQIPDKEDQMYVVTRDDLYLVPTAEVPVTNIHRDEIIEADRACPSATSPTRHASGARPAPRARRHAASCACTSSTRSRWSASRSPTESDATLEWLTERAEIVLQRLGLAYRVKLMATGDMGFVQAKKYDIEVWAPGVQDWLEVSIGLELPRLPGAPHEHPLAAGAGREAGDPAHAQRLGPGSRRGPSQRCSRSISSPTAQSNCQSRSPRE